jgi:quercetin dioxygenase-like cupin family protein
MTPTPHSPSANTDARPGWTFIDGLADAHPGTVKTDYDIPRTDYTQAKPAVERLAREDGATVVRLAFRAGDVMADHHAAAPILILGQAGTVEVSIHPDRPDSPGSPDDSDTDGDHVDHVDRVTLYPGSAVHIAAGRVHSLRADGPATATLLVLG